MPSAKLYVVRLICAAWERGEMLPRELAAELAHPEIEIAVVDGPEPSSRKGLAAATPGIEAFLSLWDDYRVEIDDCRELDDERVLVLGRVTGRGTGSGVEIAQRRASVFHVRDGKVTRLIMYWDCDRALADLGLAPQSDAAGTRRGAGRPSSPRQ
jgi:ketosteroid isomerase-like protein